MLTQTSPLEALELWSSHPSAFLALNRETQRFESPRSPGFIAYRGEGGWLFQIGGVFAPPESQATLLEDFRAHARKTRKRICVLQLRPEDVPLYSQVGFRVNQLGQSFTVALDGWKTAGTKFMQLRNKVNKARKEGIKVDELGVDAPATQEVRAQLEQLTTTWLATKGKKKLLEFLIGELGGAWEAHRRTFVARQGDKVVGFITYVPAWGQLPGMLHDLCRRTPDAPPGVMELVNVTAIDRFQKEGIAHLHFGLTPFLGANTETDHMPGRSPLVSWMLAKLEQHGGAVYPARSQAAYKQKWFPQIVQPEYLAFEGRFRLGCLYRLLVLTRSI